MYFGVIKIEDIVNLYNKYFEFIHYQKIEFITNK